MCEYNKHACAFPAFWPLPCCSERLGECSVQESLNADMLRYEKLVEKFGNKPCAAFLTRFSRLP